jgi:AcrR family transcriptional regulator
LGILTEAASVFRRRGFDGASVGDIASALSMTKGNLYYYFKNKEELLYRCHDHSLDLILRQVQNALRGSEPADVRLRRLISAFVHLSLDVLDGTAWTLKVDALSPEHRRRIVEKRDRVDAAFCQLLVDGIESGVFAPMEPRLVSFAIMGTINWIPRWFEPNGLVGADEIAETFSSFLVSGLLHAEDVEAGMPPVRPSIPFGRGVPSRVGPGVLVFPLKPGSRRKRSIF